MKKLYSILLFGALATFSVSAAKSVPYGPEPLTSIADGVSDDSWSKYNADGSLTWSTLPSTQNLTLDGTNYGGSRLWCSMDDATVNDWLVSPAITLEAGKNYKLTYYYYVWNASDTKVSKLDVRISPVHPSVDAATAAASQLVKTYTDLTSTNTPTAWTKQEVVVKAEKSGSQYVTFHLSGTYKRGAYISALSVEETNQAAQTPGGDTPEDPVVEAKKVPYTSPIALNSSSMDEGWAVIDANKDNRTWTSYSDSSTKNFGGSGYAARSYYHSSNMADDWLISPAIHLEAGKEYKVFYYMKTGSDPESMKVYATTSDKPAEISATEPIKEYSKLKQTTYKRENATIKPAETGNYYVAFHACTDPNKYYIFLSCFEVCENVFTPSGVTDLTAERDAMRDVKVNLSWTLPTSSTFGDPFTAEQTIESISIYRNGGERAIAILDGTATTFTDSEEYGLEPGTHSYEVEVTVAGKTSPRTSVGPTKYVGPLTPVAVPADLAITSESFDDWSVIKGETSANVNNWAYYSNNARYQVVANKAEEDYLITPPVAIAEAGYYLVTVNAMKSTSYNYSNKLEVRCGKGMDKASLSTVLCEQIPLTNKNAAYQYVVRLDEAGTYYFSVVAANPAPTNNMQLSVYGVKIEQTEKTPAAVTDLTATPDADEALKVVLNWTVPALSTNGDALASDEYTIEVSRGSDVLATLPGGTATYTDESLEKSGIYTYTVKTLAPKGSFDKSVEVTTAWVGPRIVELPYSTGFSTADQTRQIWEVMDGNADEKTWCYENQSYVCDQPAEETDGVYSYDDYLLSPYFDLTPGYYSVDFRTRGGYSYNNLNLAMNVGIIPAGTALPGRVTLEQPKQYIINSGSSWQAMDTYVFHVEEAGRYQVVFAANEPNSKVSQTSYRMALDDVKVAAYPVLPGVVSDLTVTPGADQELTATVSWTNPATTNVEGLAPVLTRADIYRGDVLAGTITEGLVAGEAASFTDETIEVPGKYTYKVEVFTEAGKSATAAPEVTSAWIGGGLPTPVSYTGQQFNDWTLIDVDGDKSTWGDNAWSVNNTALKADVTKTANDWAISPCIDIEYFKVYNIIIDSFLGASYDKYGPYEIDLYAGQGEDYTTYTLVTTLSINTGLNASNTQRDEILVYGSKLVGVTPAPAARANEVSDLAVKVPHGATSFAFHARNAGGVNIKNFSVEYKDLYTGIEGVEASEGVIFNGTALEFAGTATDVRVYDLAGKLCMAAATAENSVDLSALSAGVYVVTMTLEGENITFKVVK